MTKIDFDKIFELLSDKSFQNHRTGNLFFPAYIYTYKPEEEYEVREKIDQAVNNLARPSNYLNTLSINVYHELIEFLKNKTFMKRPLLDLILEKEKMEPKAASDWVKNEIPSFVKHIIERVQNHFNDDYTRKAYLILYGFGSIFPYMRASELIKQTESLIKNFKVIVFFPGEYENSHYRLFNIFNDENTYRANHLNKMLSEEQIQ